MPSHVKYNTIQGFIFYLDTILVVYSQHWLVDVYFPSGYQYIVNNALLLTTDRRSDGWTDSQNGIQGI